jgi:hypothetical protein
VVEAAHEGQSSTAKFLLVKAKAEENITNPTKTDKIVFFIFSPDKKSLKPE